MSRQVCILLPRTGLYPGLGKMLADAFGELGWQPTVRHRADADALRHDLLLLAGFCRYIEGLPAVLAQRRGRSPVTLLWQLEPLPPEQLSPLGEQVGRRLAALDWGRLPRPARKLLGNLIPFRTQLLRTLRRWRAREYTRAVRQVPDQEGWIEYDVENCFNAAGDWEWIRHARAQGWVDHCFATVQPRVRFLERRGVPAGLAPFGYHPDWGRDRQLPRDIDVLFLGALGRGPRHVKLCRLQDALAARGRTLTFVSGVQGAVREAWLNRARIVLCLLRTPHDLPAMRVMLGLACGALVVCESCADTGAFVAGEHFVMTSLEDMPAVIDRHLTHDVERQEIAAAGHRFVTKELTLPQVLRRMLAVANLRSSP